MTGLLDTISGHLAKPLVVGSLLPVLLFGSALFVLNGSDPNAFIQPEYLVAGLTAEWKLAVAGLAALAVAGLLHVLNRPLIRWYEGYPWKETYLGRMRTARHRRRFQTVSRLWRGLRTVVYAADKLSRASTTPGSPVTLLREEIVLLRDRWRKAGDSIMADYPEREQLILPTRLGNVIRCFERYPRQQYGMVAVTLYERLLGVADKTFASAIESQRSLFSLMLNSSFLSFCLGGLVLLRGLLDPAFLYTASGLVSWLCVVAVLLVVAYAAYAGAIGQARAWGGLIRTAFDLYRRPLLVALGYARVPLTLQEERALWRRISQQILFGDTPQFLHPLFASSRLAVRCQPADVLLEASKSLLAATADEIEVQLTIRHAAKDASSSAFSIVVTDVLPDEWVYKHGTLGGSGSPAVISGSNPYSFAVDDLLPPRDELTITYKAIRLGGGKDGH